MLKHDHAAHRLPGSSGVIGRTHQGTTPARISQVPRKEVDGLYRTVSMA